MVCWHESSCRKVRKIRGCCAMHVLHVHLVSGLPVAFKVAHVSWQAWPDAHMQQFVSHDCKEVLTAHQTVCLCMTCSRFQLIFSESCARLEAGTQGSPCLVVQCNKLACRQEGMDSRHVRPFLIPSIVCQPTGDLQSCHGYHAQHFYKPCMQAEELILIPYLTGAPTLCDTVSNGLLTGL